MIVLAARNVNPSNCPILLFIGASNSSRLTLYFIAKNRSRLRVVKSHNMTALVQCDLGKHITAQRRNDIYPATLVALSQCVSKNKLTRHELIGVKCIHLLLTYRNNAHIVSIVIASVLLRYQHTNRLLPQMKSGSDLACLLGRKLGRDIDIIPIRRRKDTARHRE